LNGDFVNIDGKKTVCKRSKERDSERVSNLGKKILVRRRESLSGRGRLRHITSLQTGKERGKLSQYARGMEAFTTFEELDQRKRRKNACVLEMGAGADDNTNPSKYYTRDPCKLSREGKGSYCP